MKTRSALLSTAAILALGLSGCGDKPADAPSPPAAAAASAPDAPTRYPLVGVVVQVDAPAGALLVKHEEIPGFMRAMTMRLLVEPSVLTSVKPGDAITAQIYRGEDGFRLADVKVVAPGS
jgi:Cu/Ag efflux protein CusF